MSDSSGSPGSSGFAGFLAPLRALADSGLELLRVRLELLGNELEEQKDRINHFLNNKGTKPVDDFHRRLVLPRRGVAGKDGDASGEIAPVTGGQSARPTLL